MTTTSLTKHLFAATQYLLDLGLQRPLPGKGGGLRFPTPTSLPRHWPLLAVAGALFGLIAFFPSAGAASSQDGPGVTGVAVTATPHSDSTYAPGATIRVRLTFSEKVDVSGVPRLKIDLNPAVRGEEWANYDNGTGTSNLTFVRELVEQNSFARGIAVLANTLELNGGTIKSTATEEDADLAHTGLDHDLSQKVYWQLKDGTATGALAINGGPTGSGFAEHRADTVAAFVAKDPEDDPIAWSVEGEDAARFDINAGGSLSFKTPPDYERPSDADSNNVYLATVKATSKGEHNARSITITVNDVDEGPTITDGPTSPSFAERGAAGSQCCQEGRLCHPGGLPASEITVDTTVSTYVATDPENDPIVWSVEGEDAAWFDINAGGSLSFKAPPDYESPTDVDSNNIYLLTVKATANGKSDTQEVDVTVTDGNDPPSFAQKKVAIEVEEGFGHYLFDYGATDPQGDTLTFSLTGEDSDAFSYEHIQVFGPTCYAALNLLHFRPEPDYEQPVDADKDNVFNVTVRVSDGTLTTDLPITVTVTDVDEAPVIKGLPEVNFAENPTAAVGEYTAVDPEGETVTLSLGGTDATSFTFTDGVLKFKSESDFEKQSEYSVTIIASDGTNDATLDVAITTTNEDEGNVPLTASFQNVPAEHGGKSLFNFELRFSENFPGRLPYKKLRDEAFQVENGRVRKAFRVVKGANQRWTISVRPASSEDVVITLPATTDCSAAGAVCTDAGRTLSNVTTVTVAGPVENSPATGAPSISGKAQVGETLTADTSGISDADGLNNATFSYRWLADDANISEATGSSYTLAAAEEGKQVKVSVSFTDDAGNYETLTSAATAAVAAPTPPDVTGVAVSSRPAWGDTYARGEIIRIRITFSETVDVTGTPRLKIDMDPEEWGQKWVAYESGSGTNSLTLSHEVVQPNFSNQGIAVLPNTLELNGGSISSIDTGADANLSHPGLHHDANHKVDWRQRRPRKS
ncbi:MAG: hypothetical protein OXR67_17655 [Chloroflexota bacterium]|nr:hypothetical protein [Chloroflexota bacterium]